MRERVDEEEAVERQLVAELYELVGMHPSQTLFTEYEYKNICDLCMVVVDIRCVLEELRLGMVDCSPRAARAKTRSLKARLHDFEHRVARPALAAVRLARERGVHV